MGETGHGGGGRQPGEEEIQGKGVSGERAVYTEWGRPTGSTGNTDAWKGHIGCGPHPEGSGDVNKENEVSYKRIAHL